MHLNYILQEYKRFQAFNTHDDEKDKHISWSQIGVKIIAWYLGLISFKWKMKMKQEKVGREFKDIPFPCQPWSLQITSIYGYCCISPSFPLPCQRNNDLESEHKQI